MKDKSFHPIFRSVLQMDMWTGEKFTKGQAWIDMILLANHESNEIILDGYEFIIKEGQILTSVLALSKRWRWSRTKTQSFIKKTQKEHMIVHTKGHNYILITLLKYGEYKEIASKKDNEKDNRKTTERQQKDTNKEVFIINNNKDVNNIKAVNEYNNVSPETKYLADDFRFKSIKNPEECVVAWKLAYSRVNIMQELRGMAAWLTSNPNRCKKNYKAFINNWLRRAQDNAKPEPAKPKYLKPVKIEVTPDSELVTSKEMGSLKDSLKKLKIKTEIPEENK